MNATELRKVNRICLHMQTQEGWDYKKAYSFALAVVGHGDYIAETLITGGDEAEAQTQTGTIDMILDEMIGANYILTQKQIKDIRTRHDLEARVSAGILDAVARSTYEAGRKSDPIEMNKLIKSGRANIMRAHGKEVSE
jgi:hypothetical protein